MGQPTSWPAAPTGSIGCDLQEQIDSMMEGLDNMRNCKLNQTGNRFNCGKKAVFAGLAKYKSEGGESDVEVPMCNECGTRISNRLKATEGRIKVGAVEIWSVVPLTHSQPARSKTR